MSARALWRGVVRFGDVRVPVRLYPAVRDRGVRLRLLHRADGAPVSRALVNPDTDEVVAYEDVGRGYVTPDGRIVAFEAVELAGLGPEPSRDVEVTRFVPPGAIEHRRYRRPFLLGPDGDDDAYAALTTTLARTGREGVARWVMRGRTYLGALRLHSGLPILVTLRPTSRLLPLERFEPEAAGALDEEHLALARRLIELLSGDLDHGSYHDEHERAVLRLVEAKREGRELPSGPPPEPAAVRDLGEALERSLDVGREGRRGG